MKSENIDLLIEVIVSFFLASILTFIPIWQLIIIPGFIAGALGKTLKRAALTSGLGTVMAWSLYTLSGVIFTSITVIFDQFGALFIGPGFAWLFVLIILLMGLVFGILGGAFGFLIKTIIKGFKQENVE